MKKKLFLGLIALTVIAIGPVCTGKNPDQFGPAKQSCQALFGMAGPFLPPGFQHGGI